MSEVRVLNGGLEDDDETGEIILRGVLDQETLKFINIGWYQRERGFSPSHVNQIMTAFFLGRSVADITLGMRGQRCKSKGDVYQLLDKCFCIDGGQRLVAAARAQKERPDIKIKLGTKVYFDTNEDSENDRFCMLGTTQVKIGPSLLIRNRKKKSPAADLLVGLNSNSAFALKDRVAWDQRKTPHELLFGYTVARIIGALHAHLVGGLKNSKPYDLLAAIDKLHAKIGQELLLQNSIRFFDAIDKCWTIRQLSGTRQEARPHLKPVFLLTIAKLFSKYPVFWNSAARDEFNCLDRYLKKLRTFPLAKYIVPGSVPTEALYEVMRKHVGLDPISEEPPLAAE